ncbi:uncharacterized protein [Diadema antillarum]|uniref:uncharacterized protein n=1 Tax=Diadema antillarum TaxID=105358 RepID=UPI003A8713D7
MADGGATGGVGSDTGYSSTDHEPPHQQHSTSSDCMPTPKSLDSYDGIAKTVEVSDQDKSESIKVATSITMTRKIVNLGGGQEFKETIATSPSEEPAQKDVNIGRAQSRMVQKQKQGIIKPQGETEIYDRVSDEDKRIPDAGIIQEVPTPAAEKTQRRVSSPGEETTEELVMRLTNVALSRTFSAGDSESVDLSHGILPWAVQCKDRKDDKTVHRSPVFRTHGTDIRFRAKLYLEGYGSGETTHFSLHITRLEYCEENTVCSVKVQVLNHKDIGKTIQCEETFRLKQDKNTIKINQLIEVCKVTDGNLGYSDNKVVVVIITVKEITTS